MVYCSHSLDSLLCFLRELSPDIGQLGLQLVQVGLQSHDIHMTSGDDINNKKIFPNKSR